MSITQEKQHMNIHDLHSINRFRTEAFRILIKFFERVQGYRINMIFNIHHFHGREIVNFSTTYCFEV